MRTDAQGRSGYACSTTTSESREMMQMASIGCGYTAAEAEDVTDEVLDSRSALWHLRRERETD